MALRIGGHNCFRCACPRGVAPGGKREAMIADHRMGAAVIQLDVQTNLPGAFPGPRCPDMERMLAVTMLGSIWLSSAAIAPAQSGPAAAPPTASMATVPGNAGPDMPPLPKGKSTILGGQIHNVDPVLDQLTLNVYGEKPLKILFDERTEVYRDGKRVPLLDLGPADHASVQTTLDGASVFAISIHILSDQLEGEYQGRVLSFDGGNGMLTLTTAPDRPAFRLLVSNSTSFKRLGQSSFSSGQSGQSDLVPGSLVAVKFDSNNRGQGVATQISVLAAPGASFIFSGVVSSLNLPAGKLLLVDPRDNRQYQIAFDGQAQISQQLRVGQHVRISADYDGSRYVAREIAIE